MMQALRRLRRCPRGAVTVDMVVLMAAVVLLGAAAAGPIRSGVDSLMDEIVVELETRGPAE